MALLHLVVSRSSTDFYTQLQIIVWPCTSMHHTHTLPSLFLLMLQMTCVVCLYIWLWFPLVLQARWQCGRLVCIPGLEAKTWAFPTVMASWVRRWAKHGPKGHTWPARALHLLLKLSGKMSGRSACQTAASAQGQMLLTKGWNRPRAIKSSRGSRGGPIWVSASFGGSK